MTWKLEVTPEYRKKIPATRLNVREMVATLSAAEVQVIVEALETGRVDGMKYYGPCACLIGWIGNARWNRPIPGIGEDFIGEPITPEEEADLLAYQAEIDRALEEFSSGTMSTPLGETWTFGIRPGHTPESNEYSALLHGWLREVIEEKEAQA